MAKSSVSQTENVGELLQILDQQVPAYLEGLKVSGADPPSLKFLPDFKFNATGVAEAGVEESRQHIIHACEKIVALLQGPTVKLTLDASGHLTSAAISIAVRLRLPQLISSDAKAPTTLDELVKATSASPDLLSMYCMLSSHHQKS